MSRMTRFDRIAILVAALIALRLLTWALDKPMPHPWDSSDRAYGLP